MLVFPTGGPVDTAALSLSAWLKQESCYTVWDLPSCIYWCMKLIVDLVQYGICPPIALDELGLSGGNGGD